MSEEYRFRDLRLDILDVSIDDVADSQRTRMKRFVNKKIERELRRRAQEQGVAYAEPHSIVKGLYAALTRQRAGMPHMYESDAKRVLLAINKPLVPNAVQWGYMEAKRNELIATMDDLDGYSLEGLEALSPKMRAYTIIKDLFLEAREETGLLRGHNQQLLSLVSSRFSPRKDPESLLLVYHAALQFKSCPDEER